MATIVDPALISFPDPKSALKIRYKLCISTPIFFRAPFSSPFSMLRRYNLTVKCANSSSEQGGGCLKDVLSGMVDSRVEEILNREENRGLLDGLEKATQRVEMAKRELAKIEKQEIEAKKMRDYINQLESRAYETAECQREILEARAMVEEAQRLLSVDEAQDEEIGRDQERLESAKAASISAVVGSLAGIPFSFTQVTNNTQLLLPLAVTFISCALFGVTFRYAVRRDLDNSQLKTGTAAAFGFVKGLATLESGPPLELEIGSFFSYALNGAVYVSENLLTFLFAAVALDFCYKMKVLSPFPIQRSASETNKKGE